MRVNVNGAGLQGIEVLIGVTTEPISLYIRSNLILWGLASSFFAGHLPNGCPDPLADMTEILLVMACSIFDRYADLKSLVE